MQKLLLVLVLLAAAAGLTYLLIPGDTSTATGEPGVAAATTDDDVATSELELTSNDGDAGQATVEPEALSATGADSSAEAPVQRQDAALGEVRLGSVMLPSGLPSDDRPTVVVHRSYPRDVTTPLAFLSEEAAAALAQAAEEGESPTQSYPVQPNGRFEYRLPADATTAWLTLESRYLGLSGPVQVSSANDAPVLLEPSLGAYIEGRVVLPAGAGPIDDVEDLDEIAEIQWEPDRMNAIGFNAAFSEDFAPSRSVILDPEGLTFELRAVTPDIQGELRIASERFAAAKVRDIETAPGGHLTYVIELTEGATVIGQVVDEYGDPIYDADIEASIDPLIMGQGGFEVRETESGADGRFVLRAVAAGDVRVAVEAEGYLDRARSIELFDGQVVEGFTIELSSGNTLAGTVRFSDGDPVVQAEVDVTFDPSFAGGMEAMNAMRGARGEGETDDSGRFRVTGLGEGPFVVAVEVEREGRPWRARLDAVRPGAEDLELVLEPPLGVAGFVVDDLGEPVTEFEVMARTVTSGMLAGLGAESHGDDVEDAEGRFFIDGLRAGEWELLARAEGHARPVPVKVTLPQAEGEETELVITRAAAGRGQVVDPSGMPVVGASVTLKPDLADLGRLQLDGAPPRAETDEEGRFELAGLPPDAIELIAQGEGFGPSQPLGVELAPGEVREGLVLELRIGGRILGTILDDEGEPMADETILVQDPTDPTSQKFVNSDGSGEFVVADLAPGTYQVMSFGSLGANDDGESGDAMAMFSDMKFEMADVREGEDTEVTLGALPANPVSVVGKLESDGEAVGGPLVTFIQEGGEGGMANMKFTQSKQDGSFELQLDEPGRYLINVQQVSGTGQQQTVEFMREIPEEPAHELTLDLPIASISGRVLRPDGEPAGNTRVTLGVDGGLSNGGFTGGQYAEIYTEADGTYELRWLRPNSYTVSVGGAAFGGFFGDDGGEAFGRVVRSGIQVAEGQAITGLDFRLEEAGTLRGKVLDPNGGAVTDAAVFLRDEQGSLVDRFSFVTSDASGEFVYTGLAPGRYTAQARTGGEVSPEQVSIDIRSGQSSEVTLTVDAGTILLVALTDREGNHVDCSVTVTGPDGGQVNGVFSFQDLMSLMSSGDFSTREQRVGPLAPGKYTIEAVASDGRDARKSVNLSGQERRRVRLRLD